ncbi:gas vesicle protein [Pseudalkalibacillus berkeleyi]|uniref:Gas vesicle protein n=1 Tax=Pseudalkalibacillus berkeleyi TaxID=1069813 RepID=A0ABS9H0M1_9BACL|nr:gas vesicle protein [Pseudalkalibacillus berkeleyi]MCF6137388.1 gas vesicle protein [Pseudalkalibacillus berkeleyi]
MPPNHSIENKDVALIDILDVILDKGVAIKGDIIISIAGVDLVYLDLRLLISSVETLIHSNPKTQMSSAVLDRQKEELTHAIN